jgi:endoglucanase
VTIYVLQDELLWGAAWLYKATNEDGYWNYLRNNIHSLESIVVRNINGYPFVGASFAEFGWDAKHAGINVLVSQVCHYLVSNNSHYKKKKKNSDRFLFPCLLQIVSIFILFYFFYMSTQRKGDLNE